MNTPNPFEQAARNEKVSKALSFIQTNHLADDQDFSAIQADSDYAKALADHAGINELSETSWNQMQDELEFAATLTTVDDPFEGLGL